MRYYRYILFKLDLIRKGLEDRNSGKSGEYPTANKEYPISKERIRAERCEK